MWSVISLLCSLSHKLQNLLSCHCIQNAFQEMYLWQSQIEIEYYSVTYFKRITEFDAL